MDTRVEQRERRRAPRHRSIEEHGVTCLRVRPGYEAVVIDISSEGALVETAYRLLPGSAVDLQLEAFARRIAVRGRVLRCAVVVVQAGSVVYRGAILFDRTLRWLLDENLVPMAGGPVGVVTTHDLQ